MKCDRVGKHLSAYLDGVLDTPLSRSVAAHLKGCQACREELDDLKALVTALGEVESAKAPTDFLQALHDRMAPGRRPMRWLKNLFLPFRARWPVQFAATVAMGVLILVVSQRVQEHRQPVDTPREESLQTVEEKNGTEPLGPKSLEFAAAPERKPPIPSAAVTQAKHLELAIIVRSQATATAGSETTHAQPGAGTSPKQPRRRTLKAMLDQNAAEPKMEPEADEPLAPIPPGTALQQVRQLIASLEGKVLSISRDRTTRQPVSILAELPVSRFSAFATGLRKITPLREPLPEPQPAANRPLRIRILLIKP